MRPLSTHNGSWTGTNAFRLMPADPPHASWHQSPEPKVLAGGIEDGLVIVSCQYGGEWQWRITVDATNADSLVLRMDNIVPESAATEAVAAGAYPAMVTDLRRAPDKTSLP